jgi:hypothetical protein
VINATSPEERFLISGVAEIGSLSKSATADLDEERVLKDN